MRAAYYFYLLGSNQSVKMITFLAKYRKYYGSVTVYFFKKYLFY